MRVAFLAFLAFLAGLPASAATLSVGPGQPYATITAAIAATNDGDTVAVQAGTYNEAPGYVQHSIALQAVGGRVTLHSSGLIGNGKGILVAENCLTVSGFNITGAHISFGNGANGAGIRAEGNVCLDLEDDLFQHNQDGVLVTNPTFGVGTVTIRHSEFDANGDTDPNSPGFGYTHNLYANSVAKLVIEDSYFHDARTGHEIKSRALNTMLLRNRIADRAGTASYSVDLPNGGNATLTGNQIEQGPKSQNPIMVNFGEEGPYSGSQMTMNGNLLENDLAGYAYGVSNNGGFPINMVDTAYYGLGADGVGVGANVSQTNSYPVSPEPVISTAHPW